MGYLSTSIGSTRALVMVLASSRMLRQISLDKLLPNVVRKYDKKKDVAVNAVLISSAIGIIMLFSGDIYVMASISNFGLLFSYLVASFSLFHFRRSKAASTFKAQLYPFLSITGIIGLMVLLIGMPKKL
jgi:APA family basic amino acid/polyamine antiporter